MDLNLLKIFISVVEEKSITKASEKLGFAQSNVTSRIKQLEKNLSCELFHRIPKGVILTREGKKFYPNAKDIVRKMELSIQEIQNQNIQSHLIIGSTESNAVTNIVPFLLNTHKDFPDMYIELITKTTKDILKLLQNYEVDIAFISGKPEDDDILVLNKIEEKLVLVEPINKLTNNYLTFTQGCAYTPIGEEFFAFNLDKIDKKLEFSNYETILGCIEAGMGKSILPISIVEKLGYENSLKVTTLPKNFSNIPTYLVCRKDYVPKIENYLRNYIFS